MATSDNSIREFVQGQYAVLLLDHVAEFKSDFIRIIFEEALLGALLEKNSPLQKRLAQFFLKLDGDQLVKQFEIWHKTIKHRSDLDCTHDFQREKQFLKALPQLVNQCVKHFKNTWISAAAHDEALARQLAKGFLHGEWFCRQLFPTIHQRLKGKRSSLKNNFRKSPSLGWLFQAMLFAATPVGPQTDAQKGKLHLILPQLLKNEEEVDDSKEAEFERCFPVKNRSSFVLGTSFLLALINALEVEAKSLKSEEDCPPVFPVGETSSGSEKIGVLTGLTTLFYDTSFSTGTDAFEKKFARLSYLFGNCNCIQFLPRPDKTHYGVFQLQSCVPGLIQAIWPAVVEKDDRSEFPPPGSDPALHTRFVLSTSDRKVVIALPPKWRDWWERLPKTVKQKNHPAEILNRIGSHHNPWSDKLWTGFERLQAISLETAKYVEKVTKKEAFAEAFEKSHVMLERLQAPLRELTRSLEVVQNRAQNLRTIIYEPSEGLFASYPLILDLFEDQKRLRLLRNVQIQLSHGAEYNGTEQPDTHSPEVRALANCPLDGRVIWAEALCRIFPSKKSKRHTAKSRTEFIKIAEKELAQTEADRHNDDLWESIKFICSPNGGRVQTVKELLRDMPPGRCLKNLKKCCFDPFKVELSGGWYPLALALALRRYGFTYDAERHTNQIEIKPEWTPVRYSSILSFLLKVAACIRSRNPSLETVVIKDEIVDHSNSTQSVSLGICFAAGVIDSAQLDGISSLRRVINEHVLRLPRDWRIEASTVGNFQQPFYELASSIVGLEDSQLARSSSSRWSIHPEPLLSSGDLHEIIKVSSNNRTFIVEAGATQGIRLRWVPRETK